VDHLKRQGLPARLSVDAGPYICNMAFYLSLDGMGGTGNPRSALFVHVPPITNSGSNADGTGLSQAHLRRCAQAVIDHALAEVRGVAIPETI
jgi:pyrrolidone-carboxylate peptidase